MHENLKILIKFPTRGRPEKFFDVLNKYIKMANNPSKIAFLISADEDDPTMNNADVKAALDHYSKNIKLVYFFGNSKTKIQAVNADMNKVSGWDILLLASDDMIPIIKGYDDVIRKDMNDYFKGNDGVLWYKDGGQDNINTLCILGKKYYDQFGYIYHPDYISLWCDNEFTEVSKKLNKFYKSDRIIIEHQHPVYQKTNFDELYARNESYFNIDRETYKKREEKNFDLDSLNTKIFSILIASIPERIDKLKKIIDKLQIQIKKLNLEKKVEILSLLDNRNRSVGSKRQILLDASEGKFISFLDDDDDIFDDFVEEITNAISLNSNVDVISFNQKATIGKDAPIIVYFGLQNENMEYTIYSDKLYRKPFHMCAWNKKLASKVSFKNISKTEDWVWIEEMCKLANTEYHIDKILHHYIFDYNTTTSLN